jgi:hypothetical protein
MDGRTDGRTDGRHNDFSRAHVFFKCALKKNHYLVVYKGKNLLFLKNLNSKENHFKN